MNVIEINNLTKDFGNNKGIYTYEQSSEPTVFDGGFFKGIKGELGTSSIPINRIISSAIS